MKQVKIAILDMYEGRPNQGMRCLRDIIHQFAEANELAIVLDEFEVRRYLQVPGTEYDLYISSGGPGSPLDSEGSRWEAVYFKWLQAIEDWNSDGAHADKKHAFFICHSFQLFCRYKKLANVCARKSTAFGVFPVHMLEAGLREPVFGGLSDPFYTVDSRDYQVIQPDVAALQQMGAEVLCIEKERPHVPYERAVMGVRFNPYFIGTQFHPEADAAGMSQYLRMDDKKRTVIAEHGQAKWESMIAQLDDPDKIMWTYNHVLPAFLHLATGIPLKG